MRLFEPIGVHCLVDGQFGSTGKGALAAWLALRACEDGYINYFSGSIYSGGPNSGHTCYFNDEKIILKQLPTFGVYAAKLGFPVPIYLSAGAVIDRDCLKVEAALHPEVRIFVHPNAAIVTDEDKKAEESGSIAEVAGTRSGTGAALARKVMREYGAIAVNSLGRIAENVVIQEHRIKPDRNAYFMEVAQGFSLGINSQFYPKVTSRECTVMQGMADARLPPRSLAKTYMAIRTYPIRVGNVDGYTSGEWYIDQVETDWGALELPEERTTVTNRVRRVATFSPMQFFEAVRANDPDWVFVSHMDYLGQKAGDMLIQELNYYAKQLGLNYGIIVGCGPKVSDITTAKDIEGYGNNYRSANTGIDR